MTGQAGEATVALMSRKDHRRCLHVPLTRASLDRLRRLARGRSLGNAARQALEVALSVPVPVPVPAPVPAPVSAPVTLPATSEPQAPFAKAEIVRNLPVQLPRQTLARLRQRAQAAGQSQQALAAAVLHAALTGAKISKDAAE